MKNHIKHNEIMLSDGCSKYFAETKSKANSLKFQNVLGFNS